MRARIGRAAGTANQNHGPDRRTTRRAHRRDTDRGPALLAHYSPRSTATMSATHARLPRPCNNTMGRGRGGRIRHDQPVKRATVLTTLK